MTPRYGNNTLFIITAVLLIVSTMNAQKPSRGVFEGNNDIGDVLIKGSVTFDSLRSSYTIEGGGENMWYARDAFHYVWKKASHDVAISADVSFLGTGGDAHKKAGLIIRQNLDPDAPYADAVIHGDGLTSLQYREVKGGPTREVQSNSRAPKKIKIQKEGSYVFMSIAPEGDDLHSSGGSFRIKFEEPFLIGLGVCAHNNKVSEKAIFSHVEIIAGSQTDSGNSWTESTLETIAIDSKDRKAVYTTTGFIEGAFWFKGSDSLFFSSKGQLYTIRKGGGTPKLFNTDTLKNLGSSNGLYAFSPEGAKKWKYYTGGNISVSPAVAADVASVSMPAGSMRRVAAPRRRDAHSLEDCMPDCPDCGRLRRAAPTALTASRRRPGSG